jgi:hypothetical protein
MNFKTIVVEENEILLKLFETYKFGMPYAYKPAKLEKLVI